MPLEDRQVDRVLFDSFEDITDTTVSLNDEFMANPKRAIEENILQ
jgi:hypothetical protein